MVSSCFARLATMPVLVCLALVVRVEAGPIEPNNSPNKATALTSGVLIVNDDLNGNVGRPDTLLGQFAPNYATPLSVNDNATPPGNGLGSQLLQVPLNAN